MPQGLQIWDDQGRLMVDTNTSLSQVLGSFSLGDGHPAGTYSDGNFANGRPWAMVMPTARFSTVSGSAPLKMTSVTVSGTTISYTDGDRAVIVYGIY